MRPKKETMMQHEHMQRIKVKKRGELGKKTSSPKSPKAWKKQNTLLFALLWRSLMTIYKWFQSCMMCSLFRRRRTVAPQRSIISKRKTTLGSHVGANRNHIPKSRMPFRHSGRLCKSTLRYLICQRVHQSLLLHAAMDVQRAYAQQEHTCWAKRTRVLDPYIDAGILAQTNKVCMYVLVHAEVFE